MRVTDQRQWFAEHLRVWLGRTEPCSVFLLLSPLVGVELKLELVTAVLTQLTAFEDFGVSTVPDIFKGASVVDEDFVALSKFLDHLQDEIDLLVAPANT